MSAQFTPGPWRANDSEGAGNCGPNIFPFMVEAGTAERSTGPVVAEVYGDLAGMPAEANARLIAAAPTMLEALEAFVSNAVLSEHTDRADVDAWVLGKARAAIAKARSEGR